MKIVPSDSPRNKRRWKIVRTDNYADVPGEIVTADEATGECMLRVGGETKQYTFPCGIRIIGKR